MALGMLAEEIKEQMGEAVLLRREWEAMEVEWRDLLSAWEDWEMGDDNTTIIREVAHERAQLKQRLTSRCVRNWARISRAPLTPLQRRILGLRFVRGCPWGDLMRELKRSKQYLIREHNKALERLAAFEAQGRQKNF